MFDAHCFGSFMKEVELRFDRLKVFNEFENVTLIAGHSEDIVSKIIIESEKMGIPSEDIIGMFKSKVTNLGGLSCSSMEYIMKEDKFKLFIIIPYESFLIAWASSMLTVSFNEALAFIFDEVIKYDFAQAMVYYNIFNKFGIEKGIEKIDELFEIDRKSFSEDCPGEYLTIDESTYDKIKNHMSLERYPYYSMIAELVFRTQAKIYEVTRKD